MSDLEKQLASLFTAYGALAGLSAVGKVYMILSKSAL